MNKSFAILVTLGLTNVALSSVSMTAFKSIDVQAIHDEEVLNEKKGEAPRFAVPHAVKVNPTLDQSWEKTADGFSWVHRVKAPNAVSLNFGFSKFKLPHGATLNIYSTDRSEFIRSFTSAENNVNNQLWTPVIMSDDVIIEVKVPEDSIQDIQIELSQVGQGFRTFSQSTLKSGACNVDVACSDSKGWEKEVNSVGVISTGGSRFCTGFMVNNTQNDRTPYFMTAQHCRVNSTSAASLVVYWNYQTSQCKGPRDGKLTDFQSGSVHLASYAKSDMTLVRLNQEPKAEWNVNYAGWDASADIGSPAVAIHHPNTDEKSISFENDPTVLSSYSGSTSPGDGTHVKVRDWDSGTTEPGSSGSPLFNEDHRVIGQLHGGGAVCGNNLPDYYGRFHTSWKGDGTKTGSLKDHLDSAGTGSIVVDTI